jgi:glutamyl-tRNA synthetase
MIVTRFAPSPTGYIHIGNIRSAIYPWLLARQDQDGDFILRIEDTDRLRYVEGATDKILETLTWLGLNWNEGPEVGGPHAPYYQSERRELYQEFADKLLEKGRAYYDPTPAATVDEYRKADAAAKRPFLFRNHRPNNISVAGDPQHTYPIRFVSDPKPRAWHDEVMGDLSAGPEVQDDIILIKADGLPTYNFAHIVDDFLMGVTHIIRGSEYLSSMPNYLAIYEALDITPPKFVSLPHVLASQGNKKLSKRDGAKSVTDYRDDGILPEALLNYLACLGWNDGTEQEIYTRQELIEKFSLDRIQTSGARFDEQKLFWTNGQWIRRIATENNPEAHNPRADGYSLATERGINELYSRTTDFWPESAASASDEHKKQVLHIIYDRLKTLSDLREMTDYFFKDPEIDLEMLKSNKFLKKLSPEALKSLLDTSIAKLDSLSTFTPDAVQDALNALLEETGEKPATLFSLLRLAVSFAPFSPALNLTFSVLGKDTVMTRLQNTTEKIK